MKKHGWFFVWMSLFLITGGENGWAQDRKIDIPPGHIAVSEIIRLIETQSAYTIAFNHAELDVTQNRETTGGAFSIDNLLSLLLEGTDCIFHIRDKHIVIQKEKRKTGTASLAPAESALSPLPPGDKTEYTGQVFDGKTRHPLAYATLVLLDEAQEILTAGVTNDQGLFRLSPKRPATRLRISFVGYQTIELDLDGKGEALGQFNLEEDETRLHEVTVTASGVEYFVDRNSYIVTEEMRRKSSDAQDLLEQIHGIRVDRVSNTVKVGNETAVLLLVDGIQQSQQYIKNLPPERVQRIEVVNQPSGRFLTEGYAAIINYILKKDYTGYDFLLRNFAILSPFGSNGNDWLQNEQPMANFTFTRNRVNLYGTFVYGRSRWNTPVERTVKYAGTMHLESDKASTSHPNDHYKNNGNYATIGMNYHITDSHILSAQAEQTYGDVRTENTLWMRHAGNSPEAPFILGDKTVNRTKDRDWITSLFYQGQLNERWSLYSDFSYNYYENSIYNEYFSLNRTADNQPVEWSYNLNEYEEDKKLTSFNAEVNYIASPLLTLNIGYSNVWRRYHSDSKAGKNFLKYKETRNKFFFYLSLNPNANWKIKAGAALENIDVSEKESRHMEWSLQPYLQMNYEVSKTVNIHAAYATNNYYPSLYQLSPMTTAIDTFLTQIGNPDLQSAIRHSASLRLTFRNRLSVVPTFKYTPKRISEIYTRQGEGIFRSFANINARQYGIQLLLDQPLSKYFTLNAMAMYYYGRVKHAAYSNTERGWLLDTDVSYFNPSHQFGATLGYYRGLEKSIMLQGYQNTNMDHWIVSLHKQWWNNRISLNIDYILPFSWGVRWTQKKEIDTPFFSETVNRSLRTYENMLLVRLGIRFNSGQVKQSGRQSTIERERREQRTTPF